MIERRYAPRPNRSKDGRTWRDFLTTDEQLTIARYEGLLGANAFLRSWRSLPGEVHKIRDRAAHRLAETRNGRPYQWGKSDARRTTAKLDWNKVRAIRMSGDKYTDLAERYGVKLATIKAIRQGRIWVEHEGEKYPRSAYLRGKRSYESRTVNVPLPPRDECGRFVSTYGSKSK